MAEEAALRQHYADLDVQLRQIGLRVRSVEGDGNCFFRAVSDQISGTSDSHGVYRKSTAEYMMLNQADFRDFIITDSYEDYVATLSQDGIYVDNDTILAFARMLGITVVIHQLNQQPISIPDCVTVSPPYHHDIAVKEVHVTYVPQHYNSLRWYDEDPDSTLPADIRKADFRQPPPSTERLSSRSSSPAVAPRPRMKTPKPPPNQRTFGSPNRRTSGSPSRRTSESPSRWTSESPSRRTSESPSRRTSGSLNRRTSESPNRRTSGSPNQRTSGSPNQRTSGSPRTLLEYTQFDREAAGSILKAERKSSPRRSRSPSEVASDVSEAGSFEDVWTQKDILTLAARTQTTPGRVLEVLQCVEYDEERAIALLDSERSVRSNANGRKGGGTSAHPSVLSASSCASGTAGTSPRQPEPAISRAANQSGKSQTAEVLNHPVTRLSIRNSISQTDERVRALAEEFGVSAARSRDVLQLVGFDRIAAGHILRLDRTTLARVADYRASREKSWREKTFDEHEMRKVTSQAGARSVRSRVTQTFETRGKTRETASQVQTPPAAVSTRKSEANVVSLKRKKRSTQKLGSSKRRSVIEKPRTSRRF
ncbi:putative OTU domain-containing protein 3 [Hypsibius exemplaris]|uniref:OTU domain-containing protein 3 n=1 Tax=Hypsibius exemplaris TaxID=2072580 RepID=A0A1W0X1N2_HYPEX|nr:putative OTU domain-containing protein 3 [Hypsibius exemplaris]